MSLDALRAKLSEWKRRFQIDPEHVVPLFSFAIARSTGNFTQHNRPYDPSDDHEVRLSRWGARLALFGEDTASLIYNGLFFVRVVAWPCGIYALVRWRTDPAKRNHLVVGLGGKLNGTWSAEFRVQSDESSAAGATGQNFGQTLGWTYGPH